MAAAGVLGFLAVPPPPAPDRGAAAEEPAPCRRRNPPPRGDLDPAGEVAAPPVLLVTDVEGAPLPGVPAQLFDLGWRHVAGGRSDARGLVRFAGADPVEEAPAWRVVLGDGRAFPRIERVVPADAGPAPIRLSLDPGVPVRVRVTVAGLPRAGAEVVVEGPARARAETGEDGVARVVLAPGRACLTVLAGGFVLDRREVAAACAGQEVEVALPRLHRVRGRLVDGAGRPVGGAGVTVASGGGHARLLTGRDGSFHAPPLPAGDVRLSAVVPGRGCASASVPPADGDPEPATVVLDPGRRMRVIASAEPSDGLRRAPVALSVAWVDPVSGAVTPAGSLPPHGAEVGACAAGQRLRVEAPGFSCAERTLTAADVARGEVRIDLVPAFDVEGRVLRADAAPAAGLAVAVEWTGEPAAPIAPGAESVTLRDGTFRLCGLPAGTAVLAVSAGDRVQRFQVRVARDGDVGDLCLR